MIYIKFLKVKHCAYFKCECEKIRVRIFFSVSVRVSEEKMRVGMIARPSLSLPLSFYVVAPGIEPGTHGFSVRCSTN